MRPSEDPEEGEARELPPRLAPAAAVRTGGATNGLCWAAGAEAAEAAEPSNLFRKKKAEASAPPMELFAAEQRLLSDHGRWARATTVRPGARAEAGGVRTQAGPRLQASTPER